MHILLTNDDGIYADGIRHMADFLSQFYRVTVVAPSTEQSAKSHSITTDIPLQVKALTDESANPRLIAITGTPTDCMKWALSYKLVGDDKPNLIISGVNNGYNLGSDALYSGTVAAAMEGCMYNIPSMALSIESYCVERGTALMPVVQQMIERFFVKHQFKGMLNVNFPKQGPYTWDKVQIVPQGMQRYVDIIDIRKNRRGKEYFWIGGNVRIDDDQRGTDVDLIEQGVITVTPLQWKQQDDLGLQRVKNIMSAY